MLTYKRYGSGCEVQPLQIGGAHTCACGPKPGRARCVRATQKMVTTHALVFCTQSVQSVTIENWPWDWHANFFYIRWQLLDVCVLGGGSLWWDEGALHKFGGGAMSTHDYSYRLFKTKGYSTRYLFCIFFLNCWFKRKRYHAAAEKRIEKKVKHKKYKIFFNIS